MTRPLTRLLLVLGPLGVFYAYLISRPLIPQHDTLSALIRAHYIFSGIGHHHEFAFWSPFTAWGIDNTFLFWQAALPPSLWFLLPLALIKNLNFLHLYYVSLFLSEVILITGTYLLARRLYRQIWSALFVCLCISGSVLWASQIFFNFHAYYALPFCLYFITRGAQERNPTDLLLSALVLVMTASLASTFYLSLLVGLFWLVFLLSSCHTFGFSARSFLGSLRPVRHGLMALGILVLFLHFAYFFASGMEWTVVAPNRSHGGTIGLRDFLEYADSNFVGLAPGLFDGVKNAFDFNAYAGLLVLPLGLLGTIFTPHRHQIPLLVSGTALFLFWLGSASFVAPLTYYLPGFSYFRHIGLIFPLLKLVLVLLAGFGGDVLIDRLYSSQRPMKRLDPTIWLIALLLFQTALAIVTTGKDLAGTKGVRFLVFEMAVICTVLAFWVNRQTHARVAASILLLIVGLDVWSYRFASYYERMVVAPSPVRNLFRLRPLEYQASRTLNYFDHDTFNSLSQVAYTKPVIGDLRLTRDLFERCVEQDEECRLFVTPGLGVFYDYYEAFLGFDPCRSIFRSDITLPAVARLYEDLSARSPLGAAPSFAFNPFQLTREDRLKIGCQESKAFLSPTHAPVTVAEFSPNHIRFAIDAREPQTFTYLNAWHRNWTARLNGTVVPIERVDNAFQGIQVTRGQHQLVLTYSNGKEVFVVTTWAIVTLYLMFLFKVVRRRWND